MRGVGMKEQTVRLGPREQQIVELLLQGCDNAEIAINSTWLGER